MSKELLTLIENRATDTKPWVAGRVPKHYKSLSVSTKEAVELAKLGATKIGAYFNEKLYFSQSVIAGAILSGKYDEFVIITPSQYGKALADDTPVLTRNGWKKHGDLVVGDEVVSPNGSFVKVLQVHPKCEMDRVVVLENGDEFICHHNHEWVCKHRNQNTNEYSTKNIPVWQMEERGLQTGGKNKFVIPAREALIGEKKELSVPPYVMGAWLGDGSTTKGQICGAKGDIAVLDKCREHYQEGSEWTHKETGVITRSFIGLADDLTKCNLCFQRKDTPDKYIPDEYMTASIEQRLELLAGLIDTDGYCFHDERNGGKSRMYFTTAGEQLRDSFERLIATFGWKTSTVRIEPTESSSGIKGRKPYFVIGFNPTMEIPCVLERKRVSKVSTQRGIGIKEIRKTSGIQGNCITVDGGEYCVGNHMITTHNSWLMGMLALLNAFNGRPTYIAAANTSQASIIMGNVIDAVQRATPEIQNALLNTKDQLEKLAVSLSKSRVAFANGGFVEAITLADTFENNVARNQAVGRGGDFFVDEAALVSDDTFSEMSRREFARNDGKKYNMVMISNPHKPGYFYDHLTEDPVPEGRFVLWMDALTAIEEERWPASLVIDSDFDKNRHTRRVYLLCELDVDGDSMFDTPKLYNAPYEDDFVQYFLGVDAAYKGKDNICVSLNAVGEDGKCHIEEVLTIDKGDWNDDTPRRIIDDITRIARRFRVALVCVDVGWGVWLVQGLKENNIPVKGVNFAEGVTKGRKRANQYAATNGERKRDEMHLDLQNLIEDDAIFFSEQAWEAVKAPWPFITSERKANGKIKVREKKAIKAAIGKSPDELDAVLLSIQAPIVFNGEWTSFE